MLHTWSLNQAGRVGDHQKHINLKDQLAHSISSKNPCLLPMTSFGSKYLTCMIGDLDICDEILKDHQGLYSVLKVSDSIGIIKSILVLVSERQINDPFHNDINKH